MIISSLTDKVALTDQYGNFIPWPQVGQITDSGNTWAIQGLQNATVNWGYIGSGVYERNRLVNTLRSTENNTLNSGSTLNIWTPSGKKFRVMGLAISAFVGGRYLVYDGSNIMMYFTVPNVGFATVDLQNGIPSSTTGNVLSVVNQTGSQSAVRAIAWGIEE